MAPTSDPRDVPGATTDPQHRPVTRQRITRQDGSLPASAEQELADPTMAAIGRAGGGGPERMRSGLLQLDQSTRSRAVQRLQADAGNRAVGAMIGVQPILQREGAEPTDTGVVALDATTGGGATETIGPETSSSYAVAASSLADVAAVIGGRAEAGHVGWVEQMSSSANTGPTVDTVSVTVGIDLEMPSWSTPSAMLPRARAEWSRWYAALMAHEQGHIQLVHDVHDGQAATLLGKTPSAATTAFNASKASLTNKSNAYDTKTGHGLKTGTVLDVGIETLELDEERKKREAAEKAKGRESAVPDVPEDE